MAAHRQSPYVAVTRALLTVGAAVALTRVFAGSAWLLPVLVAGALPGAILAWGERRRWNPWLATGLTVVVGAWFTIFVDDPSETVLGIPSASALADVGHDLTRAPHVLRSAVVPVPPVGAALMLAVVAVLVAALATELIARRLDAPVGAIGPSVALFVAICALGSGRWVPSTACYAIAVVEYLVALQYAELLTRRTWFQSNGRRRTQVATGGAAAGVLVVAVALAFGPGIPGARGAAWIEYRSLGTGKGSSILNVTSPLVSVHAKLTSANSNKEVFTVRTTEPKGDYWRVIALDRFQDDGWGLNSDQKSAAKLPGPTHALGTTRETQTFHLRPTIDARWLPAAYRPTHMDVPGAQVLPDSTSLFVDKPLSGLSYTVESEVSNPPGSVLNAVTFDDLQAMAVDTQLPPDFSGRARGFAQDVTKNATTPYEKAIALMQVFREDPFVYDQSVTPGASTAALDTFLFKTHRGFCEQYASAYAELARSIGLPTRVAVGYQPGTYDKSDGLWHVQEKDAHAWPEVWLGRDVGWYRFEPTPGRTDPITGLPGGARAGGNGGPTTTTPPTTSAPNSPTTNPANNPAAGHLPFQPQGGSTSQSGTRAHVLTGIAITLAALLFALIVLVVAFAFAAFRRSSNRRHDPDDRRRVLSAWSEALERLSAAGIERRPSATSLEFALRQAPALGAGAAGPPLMSLARLHTAAMYAPDAPSREDADEAWSEVDAIASAVRATTPLSKRLRARWSALLPRRSGRRTAPGTAGDQP
jgi:transglutaminase-like putative cysteine protease